MTDRLLWKTILKLGFLIVGARRAMAVTCQPDDLAIECDCDTLSDLPCCHGAEFRDCTVVCHGSACNSAKFYNSKGAMVSEMNFC